MRALGSSTTFLRVFTGMSLWVLRVAAAYGNQASSRQRRRRMDTKTMIAATASPR